MKITVFGAGAIGGTLAGKISASGQACSLIARGETVQRLTETGVSVTERGKLYEGRPSVVDVSATTSLGPQDIVFLATKAHHIESALPALKPLIGPGTLIVPAINGIPWWYSQGVDDPKIAGRQLLTVDPSGSLTAALPSDQIIGCVVYIAAVVKEPGVIDSIGPRRLMLGGATATGHRRTGEVAEVLKAAEFTAPVDEEIRKTVWVKLWGNLHANPISVLTAATMEQTTDDPYVREVSRAMMTEAAAVAEACGFDLGMSIEERLDQGKGLGNFKTSMLQDFENSRTIELDAILGAVMELADWYSIETPMMDAVYGLTRLRAITAGCYTAPN